MKSSDSGIMAAFSLLMTAIKKQVAHVIYRMSLFLGVAVERAERKQYIPIMVNMVASKAIR